MVQYASHIIPLPDVAEKVATRNAYGKALEELGAEDPRVVVLDADLSGSTRTSLFAKKFPKRFFNAGIAEQNMVGMAAGFALGGNIPFISSFAIFLTGRAWEPVRQSICYPNLNVKLVASHAGLTVGEDGGSHQSLEDITLTRVLPNMRVMLPADAVQTGAMLRYARDVHGPVYIRTSRPNTPVIYRHPYHYRPDEADLLVKGEKIAVITAGVLVGEAMQALESLAKEGIFPSLINLHTIKPLPEASLLQLLARHSKVITFEEHSVYGGLGSAVAELCGREMPMPIRIHGMTQFGKSGTPDQLLEKFGLNAAAMVQKIKEWM